MSLDTLSWRGDARARAALELSEEPYRFLATVQVSMTLIGIMAGAFGGVSTAKVIAGALQAIPALARYGEAIGIGAVALALTFLSVVLGELVSKRLALNNPRSTPEPPVSEEDVRTLVEQGHHAGVFFKTEKKMVERALVLDTKHVGDLMTQRAQIVWLNAADAIALNWRKTVTSGHSYFPVYETRSRCSFPPA